MELRNNVGICSVFCFEQYNMLIINETLKSGAFVSSLFLSFLFFLKLRKPGQHATKGKMGGEQRDSLKQLAPN